MMVTPSPDSRTYAFMSQNAGAEEAGGRACTSSAMTARGSREFRHRPAARRSRTGRGGAGGGPGGAASRNGRETAAIFTICKTAAFIPSRFLQRRTQPAAAGWWTAEGAVERRRARLLAAANASTPRRIQFSVRMEIDRAAERRQVFEEAWRMMKNRFYDRQHARRELGRRERYIRNPTPDIADTG